MATIEAGEAYPAAFASFVAFAGERPFAFASSDASEYSTS